MCVHGYTKSGHKYKEMGREGGASLNVHDSAKRLLKGKNDTNFDHSPISAIKHEFTSHITLIDDMNPRNDSIN